jgi:hypothetical protein
MHLYNIYLTNSFSHLLREDPFAAVNLELAADRPVPACKPGFLTCKMLDPDPDPDPGVKNYTKLWKTISEKS